MNVYYVTNVQSQLGEAPTAPAGVELRPSSQADVSALAELYARAYDLGSDAYGPAVAEMESAFDGTWGALWPEASPVAWMGSKPVAVVQTVRRPAWEGAPDCPWLIEVFTDPDHRRGSFARTLVRVACAVIAEAGKSASGSQSIPTTFRP